MAICSGAGIVVDRANPIVGEATAQASSVVTDQVVDVVDPTVTEVVTAVLKVLEEVNCIAIVSPELKPATGPAVKAPELREIPMQPALQLAVRLVNVPLKVTGALLIVALTFTPV